MKHDQLKIDLQAPSVTLMRSDNAPLILSFFYQEFKVEPVPSIPLNTFTEHLDRYLDKLREDGVNLYRETAKNYIKQWSEDKAWLRIYRPRNNPDYVVELTLHSEHALGWVQDLQTREFVGTESRFSQILNLLNEIAVKSNTNPEERIRQIKAEQLRLENEIALIEATGEVEQLTQSQIRERFQLATEQAGQLLRDFTAVEEQFRDIARLVQKEQMRPDIRKGTVVGKVLDADERLREAEIGRSFYAFWDFLQQPAQRDDLYRLLEQVFTLDVLGEVAQSTPILRDMPRYLIDAGLKVDQSNQRLAEQLRRMLDETTIAESRRIRTLIGEVKQLFGEHPDIFAEPVRFIEIELLPETQLVMERDLWFPKETATFNIPPLEEADTHFTDIDINALIDVFFIDESKIRERVEAALDKQLEIALVDLLEVHPIEKGLPEIVAYLDFAARGDEQHVIHLDKHRVITARAASPMSEEQLRLRIPHIIFRRANRGHH